MTQKFWSYKIIYVTLGRSEANVQAQVRHVRENWDDQTIPHHCLSVCYRKWDGPEHGNASKEFEILLSNEAFVKSIKRWWCDYRVSFYNFYFVVEFEVTYIWFLVARLLRLKEIIPEYIMLGNDSSWEPLHQYVKTLLSIIQPKHFDKNTPRKESKNFQFSIRKSIYSFHFSCSD